MKAQLTDVIRAFLKAQNGTWEGTAQELFGYLTEIADEHELDTTDKTWPGNAAVLGRRLQDYLPELRAAGIELDRHKESTGKRRQIIHLRQLFCDEPQQEDGEQGDTEQDWLDDPDVDEATRKCVLGYRSECKRILAEQAAAEKTRERIRGCLIYTRGNRYRGF